MSRNGTRISVQRTSSGLVNSEKRKINKMTMTSFSINQESSLNNTIFRSNLTQRYNERSSKYSRMYRNSWRTNTESSWLRNRHNKTELKIDSWDLFKACNIVIQELNLTQGSIKWILKLARMKQCRKWNRRNRYDRSKAILMRHTWSGRRNIKAKKKQRSKNWKIKGRMSPSFSS